MKIIRQNAIYGLSVMLLSIAGVGMAQDASPMMPPAPMGNAVFEAAQIGVVTTGGMAMPVQESNEVVKNQPYQAQAVTEVKQTLADGAHITQKMTATVARSEAMRPMRSRVRSSSAALCSAASAACSFCSTAVCWPSMACSSPARISIACTRWT